jgi:DNA-binding NarL/FixJ family response regulator
VSGHPPVTEVLLRDPVADPAAVERVEAALTAGGLGRRREAEPGGAVTAVVLVGPLRTRSGPDVRSVRETFPDATIVACAPEADSRAIRWAVDNGADAVVWDTDAARTLLPALRCAELGQIVIPRGARRQLQPPELTTREKQTLSMVVMGFSNVEIAARLYLSESTVKSHLATAFRKLGVNSRAEAARLIADPEHGFGTGILAITESPGTARGSASASGDAQP